MLSHQSTQFLSDNKMHRTQRGTKKRQEQTQSTKNIVKNQILSYLIFLSFILTPQTFQLERQSEVQN